MKIASGLFLASLLTVSSAWSADPVLLRGTITDRRGEVLAESRVIHTLQFRPSPAGDREIDTDAVAMVALVQFEQRTGLAPKVTAKNLARHLAAKGRLPMNIEPPLDDQTAQVITAANLENWQVVDGQRRQYPGQTLAAHVVGYVGRNNNTLQDEGRSGLEAAYDAELSQGRRVTTTLDLSIQRSAEKILATKDRPGAIVVLDPSSGDVLAMASWPSFNLNQFVPAISLESFHALQQDIHTPLIARSYQIASPPGSVFHPFSGLCVLRDGALTPDETLVCPPTYMIGKLTFRNWKDVTAKLNFSEAIREAHHVFFYQAANRLDGAHFVQLLGDFGFGRSTGLGLPSEALGGTGGPSPLPGEIANIAIGQGDVAVTPIQLAQATNVFANGGYRTPPRLVLRTSDPDGQNARENPLRKAGEPIATPAALQAAVTGMQSAMENRIRLLPQDTPFTVAGVTGTTSYVRHVNEERVEFERGTFAGFAPVDQPRFTVVVVLEECAGGRDAATLAARLLQDIVGRK